MDANPHAESIQIQQQGIKKGHAERQVAGKARREREQLCFSGSEQERGEARRLYRMCPKRSYSSANTRRVCTHTPWLHNGGASDSGILTS